MVPDVVTHPDGELESRQRKHLDGAVRRWRRPDHGTGKAARKYNGAVLWECCSSRGNFVVGGTSTDCVPISEIVEASRALRGGIEQTESEVLASCCVIQSLRHSCG